MPATNAGMTADSAELERFANRRTAYVAKPCCVIYVGREIGEMRMARKAQVYDDIPGTFVFDAERSREGYGINMFCMSLMKDDNRKAFKADEAGYLKKFKLTPEQTDAILKRDYNRMLELGGNIYFTAKLGATDGHSFQHLAAVMTGNTQDDYAKMMLGGGRSVEGNRSRTGKNTPSAFIAVGATKKASAAKPKAKAEPKAKPRSKSKSAKRK
jgi:protocatechuate 4,5-dioxygenase, alpha chain